MWAVALLAGCEISPQPDVLREPLSEDEVVLRGVVFDRFEEGQLRERVKAERVVLERGREVVRGQQVRAMRFETGPEGPPRAVAQAPIGRVEAATRTAQLSGGVTVRDAQGRVLETATVTHDAAQDRLHGASPVVVRGDDFQLEGRGFELRLGDDQLRIEGPVRATVEPVNDPPGAP